jgi:hypothetical protein
VRHTVTVLALTIALGVLTAGDFTGSWLDPRTAWAEEPVVQGGEFSLAIDADIENGNGPCDPVDREALVAADSTHRVAVCILNQPEAPQAFRVLVIYDGELNRVPEPSVILVDALDANPDANAGETSFSTPDLGTGWNCTGFGLMPPTGDLPHTEKHDAQLVCNVDIRNPVATLSESGPLGVITFEAIGKGTDRLEFDVDTEVGGENGTIGTCGQDPQQTIPCPGATIFKGVEPTPGPPATPTAEASPTVPAETPGALTPGPATPTAVPNGGPPPSDGAAEAENGGGFPWAILGGALAGAALLLLVGGGAVYLWRRP